MPTVRNPKGKIVNIPDDQYAYAIRHNYVPVSDAELQKAREDTAAQIEAAKHPVQTALENVIPSAVGMVAAPARAAGGLLEAGIGQNPVSDTLGYMTADNVKGAVSSIANDPLAIFGAPSQTQAQNDASVAQDMKGFQARSQENPVSNFVGQTAGTIVGGAPLAAAGAAAGAGTEAALGGGGIAHQMGNFAEGAAFGAPAAIAEAEDEAHRQHSVLKGSQALVSGGLGGILGGTLNFFGKGAAELYAARNAAEAANGAFGELPTAPEGATTEPLNPSRFSDLYGSKKGAPEVLKDIKAPEPKPAGGFSDGLPDEVSAPGAKPAGGFSDGLPDEVSAPGAKPAGGFSGGLPGEVHAPKPKSAGGFTEGPSVETSSNIQAPAPKPLRQFPVPESAEPVGYGHTAGTPEAHADLEMSSASDPSVAQAEDKAFPRRTRYSPGQRDLEGNMLPDTEQPLGGAPGSEVHPEELRTALRGEDYNTRARAIKVKKLLQPIPEGVPLDQIMNMTDAEKIALADYAGAAVYTKSGKPIVPSDTTWKALVDALAEREGYTTEPIPPGHPGPDYTPHAHTRAAEAVKEVEPPYGHTRAADAVGPVERASESALHPAPPSPGTDAFGRPLATPLEAPGLKPFGQAPPPGMFPVLEKPGPMIDAFGRPVPASPLEGPGLKAFGEAAPAAPPAGPPALDAFGRPVPASPLEGPALKAFGEAGPAAPPAGPPALDAFGRPVPASPLEGPALKAFGEPAPAAPPAGPPALDAFGRPVPTSPLEGPALIKAFGESGSPEPLPVDAFGNPAGSSLEGPSAHDFRPPKAPQTPEEFTEFKDTFLGQHGKSLFKYGIMKALGGGMFGPAGYMAGAVAGAVYDKMGAMAAKAAALSQKAISVALRANAAVPQSVKFGVDAFMIQKATKAYMGKEKTPEAAYKSRLAELQNLSNDGGQALAQRVGDAFGHLATQESGALAEVMQSAQRGIDYLLQHAPSTPLNRTSLTPTASKPVPNRSDLNEFQRTYSAVMYPATVLGDIKNGLVTTSQIDAIKYVHPQWYQESVVKPVLANMRARDSAMEPYTPQQRRIIDVTLGVYSGVEEIKFADHYSPLFTKAVAAQAQPAPQQNDQSSGRKLGKRSVIAGSQLTQTDRMLGASPT